MRPAVVLTADGLNRVPRTVVVVLLSTGAVDCWGDNTYGELGNGTTGGDDGANGYDTPQMVRGITNAVSTSNGGSDDNCAVLSTGGVDCWGDNGDGVLGNGTTRAPDGAG